MKESPPRSVLFIRPGGIGDAVHLVPSILSVAEQFPDCAIDVLAEKRNAAVFDLCPRVNHLYRYDSAGGLRKILTRRYDVVVDTEQWHRLSAVVARLIRSCRKIGFGTNARARMFTDVVAYSHEDYELNSFMHLFQALGCEGKGLPDSAFLSVPASVARAVDLLGPLSGPYVVLFPGASIKERQWGAPRFTELAGCLLAKGYGVVVVGGVEDVDTGVAIAANASGVVNLCGKTSLLESASILSGCSALVSGDSGLLHMGVGLGVPTVSLFGPGIAKKWAPCGDCHRVINLELPCSPCTRFGTTPPCPIGAKCIQDISVDLVFSQVTGLLAKTVDGG